MMKGGVLEVLLVGAEGLRRASLFGNAGYYVVLQCGKVTFKSSVKAGKGCRGSWNEKFLFKFPFPDWKNSSHLNMRIMATHMFTEDNFLGETIIHLGGVLEEGGQNGWLELKPALYNIVAEDGKYHGTIKLGLKYIDNVEVEEVVVDQIKDRSEPEKQLPRATYKTIFNFMRSSWLRFYFHLKHANK